MELIDIIPEFNLYEEFWKIYTKSDILPPQYLADNSKVFRSIVGEGTQVYGEVYNSVIGSGVTIEEGAIVRDSIIMQNARIGAGAVIPKKRYTAAPYTHPVCLYLPMIKRKSRKPATYSHAESTCGNASPHKIPTTNGINSRRKGCRCQLSIINPEDGLQIP